MINVVIEVLIGPACLSSKLPSAFIILPLLRFPVLAIEQMGILVNNLSSPLLTVLERFITTSISIPVLLLGRHLISSLVDQVSRAAVRLHFGVIA